MRNPARCVAGNLVWNFNGDVWAVWRIDAPTYARLPHADKMAWHAAVTGMLLSIGTESMILGLARPVQADLVAAAMRRGVDCENHPEWDEVAERGGRSVAANPLLERVHYLSVRLPSDRTATTTKRAVAAALARMALNFNLAALPVSAADVSAARIQATEMAKPLDRLLGGRLHPATEAEIEWVYARAYLRGRHDEPTLGEFAGAPADDLSDTRPRGRSPRLVAGSDVALLEAGDADDPDRPRHRRYLRADAERGTCYQSMLVFSHVPRAWIFPNGKGECLPRLGGMEFALDWCLRIRPTSNVAAQRAITGHIRKLSGQYEEYAGDLAGAPESLTEATDALREQLAALGSSTSTPELEVTYIVGIGSDNLRTLEERSVAVRTVLGANEHEVHRPTGDQRALWGAMLPASPLPDVCRHYTQYMLPADLAGTGPLTGAALGDPEGDLLGLNLDGNGLPVLFSASYGPSMPPSLGGPLSGSLALFGKVRGGKSQTAKRIVWATLARGGQVVTTDRTPMGEYASLAPVMPGTSQIVRLTNDCDVCMDPMRIFADTDASIRYTIGFLTLLTGAEPTSVEGADLADAVRRVHSDGGSLLDVVDELSADTDGDTRNMARKLGVFTRGVGLAQVAFGTAPPLRLDADYLVFHTPALQLPSREKLQSVVLSRQLMPEEVFSQALLYLITAISAEVAFADRSRYSMVVIDEGYAVSASPQGEQLLVRVGKDGPKHNAGLMFISHLPSEMPGSVGDLMGTRLLFRMARNSAPEGLRFLNLDPTSALVDLIAEDRRNAGECLMVDRYGRIGLMKVLQPHTDELVEAFNTGLHTTEASQKRVVERVPTRRRRSVHR